MERIPNQALRMNPIAVRMTPHWMIASMFMLRLVAKLQRLSLFAKIGRSAWPDLRKTRLAGFAPGMRIKQVVV